MAPRANWKGFLRLSLARCTATFSGESSSIFDSKMPFFALKKLPFFPDAKWTTLHRSRSSRIRLSISRSNSVYFEGKGAALKACRLLLRPRYSPVDFAIPGPENRAGASERR
jgi:hypothetical protein